MNGAESPTPHPSDHVPLASGTSLEGLTRYARGRPQARVGRRARGTERVGNGLTLPTRLHRGPKNATSAEGTRRSRGLPSAVRLLVLPAPPASSQPQPGHRGAQEEQRGGFGYWCGKRIGTGREEEPITRRHAEV
jgi:hypothetical protein